jgi:predicted MFS family arabinose efflux permease
MSLPAPGSSGVVAAAIRGLRAYLTVLRSPGVLVPAIGAAMASVPVGMLGLSLLLLVQQRGDGFAAAGLVVAMLGIGTGVGMIVQGRLLDLIRPGRVLGASALLRAASSVAFVAAAGHGLPSVALAAFALVIGLGEPQVSSALRAMWPTLVRRELLPAANALSSVLFELPVVAGPLLLAVVIAVLPVEAAILAAAAFSVAGAGMFTRSAAGRRRRNRPAAPAGGLLGPLSLPAVRVIVCTMMAPGAALGAVQVASAAKVAVAGAAAEQTGVVFAALTAGSLLATVLYGAVVRPRAGRRLLPVLLTGQAACLAVMAVTSEVGSLVACAFAFGLLSGPVAVRCFVDLERAAPRAPAAAVTTVIAAGLAATSAGSAAAGWVIDVWGTPPALLACSVPLLVVAAFLPARRAVP